jgi:hypothetical protein
MKNEKRRRFGLRNVETDEVVKILTGRLKDTVIQKARAGHAWIELPDGFDQSQHLIVADGDVRSKDNG